MSESSEGVEQSECETLTEIAGGPRVLLSKGAAKEFWQLSDQELARLVSLMDLWVENRPMSEKQLKNEGRCGGPQNRTLLAFKNQSVRVYGFVCPFEKRKSFIIVDIDPNKKSRKAKSHVLDRAKGRAVEFEERFGKFI